MITSFLRMIASYFYLETYATQFLCMVTIQLLFHSVKRCDISLIIIRLHIAISTDAWYSNDIPKKEVRKYVKR